MEAWLLKCGPTWKSTGSVWMKISKLSIVSWSLLVGQTVLECTVWSKTVIFGIAMHIDSCAKIKRSRKFLSYPDFAIYHQMVCVLIFKPRLNLHFWSKIIEGLYLELALETTRFSWKQYANTHANSLAPHHNFLLRKSHCIPNLETGIQYPNAWNVT